MLGILSSSLFCSQSALANTPSFNAGPRLGEKIAPLNLLDQFSNKQTIDNLIDKKGAILVLFRSADWCPFCKRHLLELNAKTEAFKNLGYGVVGISYDSPEILRIFSQSNKLNYSLLSDQNVESFKRLNVVNAEYGPGDKHYGIPYPGVIVIDKNSKVIHKYFFEGYKKRVKFTLLLKQLSAG
jgi:peroxiredoxin